MDEAGPLPCCGSWNLSCSIPKGISKFITPITTKQLVAAVSGKRDSHISSGQLGHQVGGNLGGISKRLVIHGGQQRNDLPSVLRRNHELGVIGAQVVGHFSRVAGLVVEAFMKTDRKCPYRTRALRLHEGYHGR